MLDTSTLAVVLLVTAGSGYIAGYLSGRGEREQTQRERVASRRARREELRHRAPEPNETDPETAEPTAPEPADDEVPFYGARTRFTFDGEPVHHSLKPGWRKDFDGIAAALRGDTDPLDWSTPLFHATGAALLGPTGAYQIVGTHPDGPGSDDNTIPRVPAPAYVPVVVDRAAAAAAIKAIASAGAR